MSLPRIPENLDPAVEAFLRAVAARVNTLPAIQQELERVGNISGDLVLRDGPNGIVLGIPLAEEEEKAKAPKPRLLLAKATDMWRGGTRQQVNTVACVWQRTAISVQIFSPLSVDPNVRKGYIVPFYWDEEGDATATGTWGDGLIGDRKMVNLLIEEVPEVYPGWEVVIEAENQFMAFTGDVLALNDRHSGNVFDVFLPWDESTNPPSLRADIRDHPISLTGYTGTAKNVFATADDNEHFDESEYNAPTASPPPNITPPYLVSTLIERTS